MALKKVLAIQVLIWAGDSEDRRSTSGYIFMFSSASVSWRSKKQTSVALFSPEAGYVALLSAIQKAIWMRQLRLELRGSLMKATVIFEDNQSMAKNPQLWSSKAC